jgi:hypothetical protein
LPSASLALDKTFYIKKIDLTQNAVKVLANGADTIDGLPDRTIVQSNVTITVISNGTSWYII